VNVNELFERIPLPIKPRLPEFSGATEWLNTEPLTTDQLRGKVVLVDFWTYTCINWIRTLPYLRAWADTYEAYGLDVIGVHTPEFSIEHDIENIRRAARHMRVEYPIAIDNNYAVWNAFANQYWPALYLADTEGRIHYKHFGEGSYEHTERVIRRLLADAGAVDLPEGAAPVEVASIEAPADSQTLRSPETYVGLGRSWGFVSPEGGALDQARVYTVPDRLRTNEWALAGSWTVTGERAVLNEQRGYITYKFHARDVNLILSPPSADSPPIRFRVRIDGQPPRNAHGFDLDDDGNGVVRESRLYQMIRQPGPITDRTFEIEFLDAGVSAFCFTFG
jgi:thiol-disulfide isomerase/thioredoxin